MTMDYNVDVMHSASVFIQAPIPTSRREHFSKNYVIAHPKNDYMGNDRDLT